MGPSAKLSAEVRDREQDLFDSSRSERGDQPKYLPGGERRGLVSGQLKGRRFVRTRNEKSNLLYRKPRQWSDPYLWSPQILSTTYTR